jgi:predicted metal-dependent peptidase
MDTSERLKNLIAQHVLKYNYWGYLFSRIRRQSIPGFQSIMGVGAEKDGTLTLAYNPDLVDRTSDEWVLKVLEHEGMHILNHHIPRGMKVFYSETDISKRAIKMNILNVASDCAVNEQAKLRDNFIIAGKTWPAQLPENHGLPPEKMTEWYYLELLKKTKVTKIPFGGEGGLDDHKGWEKAAAESADPSSLARKIKSQTQKIVRESAKTFNKDRGTLPAHIAALIEEALKPPKAPYYQIIRRLVRGTRLSKFRRSHTKINRKRTYVFQIGERDLAIPAISPFPGRTRDFTFKIAVLIDTSGSMSTEEIAEALSGVKNIIENDKHCKTTVLECDAAVHKEYEVKKVRDIDPKVKGGGGTTMGPGLIRSRELGVDVCLGFTDGYTENINAINRKLLPKKLIWVVSKGGSVENLNRTGFVVKLDS